MDSNKQQKENEILFNEMQNSDIEDEIDNEIDNDIDNEIDNEIDNDMDDGDEEIGLKKSKQNEILNKHVENVELEIEESQINKKLSEIELINWNDMLKSKDFNVLYPTLDDPNFNYKIFTKKEFNDTKYDGEIYDVKQQAEVLKNADYELLPHQMFVKNFLSFQTPYNSLLLYHGLGSGKTCSAIGVCEDMRDYLRQMGINKKIIIVASPDVQNNFRLQLFDERKLVFLDGVWTISGCIGDKLLKEVNPTGMKGYTKEKINSSINRLIDNSYEFMGYVQLSNTIDLITENPTWNDARKVHELKKHFSDSLLVIDEIHNIRISGVEANKKIAKNLMYLVLNSHNMRLLLLSATPMFNSHLEIVWLINLMNLNDKRSVIKQSDVFDKNNNFVITDNNDQSKGKELLIRKATGYISYVRGENPYTFPFRIYPDMFSKENTFEKIAYPKYQMGGKIIKNKIDKLVLYLSYINGYQQSAYEYVMHYYYDKIFQRSDDDKVVEKIEFRILQSLKQILNITYPYEGLEEYTKNITMEIEDKRVGGETTNTESVKYLEPSDEYADYNDAFENMEIDEDLMEKEEELADIDYASDISESEIFSDDENDINESLSKNNVLLDSDSGKKEITNFEEVIENEKNQTKSVMYGYENANEDVNAKEDVNANEDVNDIIKKYKKNKDINYVIKPKTLTGSDGLRRVMRYDDLKNPLFKGNFEYRENVPHIFASSELGKYSAKIKRICELILKSEGIVLIYSEFIDAGLIPIGLALEELGFGLYDEKRAGLFKTPPSELLDALTMKKRSELKNKNDFHPAKYIIISGNKNISPDNDLAVKVATADNNIYGEQIKVILISQSGTEGLDFKCIRQIHVLEPWFNINRIEQILGRGVRNFSHKYLEFEKRNVQIFLHGTMQSSKPEHETIDLYIYRSAEDKAVKIGQITRLLKQISIDCLLNHSQTLLTYKNFQKIDENRKLTQILSDKTIINNFKVGDIDGSITCDFMECDMKCINKSNDDIENIKINESTYDERFLTVNAEKIINKIKKLFKDKYFYKKSILINAINTPKEYPISQIDAGLSYLINDNQEYLLDMFGRLGRLINIGEYYLFQPIEIKNDNISLFDRTTPLDVKPKSIIITDIKRNKDNEYDINAGQELFETMLLDYIEILDNITQLGNVQKNRGEHNYKLYLSLILSELINNCKLLFDDLKLSENDIMDSLKEILITHQFDYLTSIERINVINYIYSLLNNYGDSEVKKMYINRFMKIIQKQIIIFDEQYHLVIPTNSKSNVQTTELEDYEEIFLTLDENTNAWIKTSESMKDDIYKLNVERITKELLNKPHNRFVGYIGYDSIKTDKVKLIFFLFDKTNPRSTGFSCTKAGKSKMMSNYVETIKTITSNNNIIKLLEEELRKKPIQEVCLFVEMSFRIFDKYGNMRYFK